MRFKYEEKKYYCSGCYNNIYNGEMSKECWCLKSAKICKKKKVHINDVPPWNHQQVITVLSCYRIPKFVFVKPEQKY